MCCPFKWKKKHLFKPTSCKYNQLRQLHMTQCNMPRPEVCAWLWFVLSVFEWLQTKLVIQGLFILSDSFLMNDLR